MSKKLVQLEWCNYPNHDKLGDAATPAMGCWSLLNGWVKSKEDCEGCELLK